MSTRLRILLLHDDAVRFIGTVDDHIGAFETYSHHDVAALHVHYCSRPDFDLNWFDAIVFHYSIIISSPNYLAPSFADRIAAWPGKKLLFIQDEFRWVDRTAEAIRKLGIELVFTVLNRDVIRKIYHHPWLSEVRFEQVLTGYVPEALVSRSVSGFADRPVDVGYRARKLQAWCGSFARQKFEIGRRFALDAPRYGLRCDISSYESDRLYGEAWVRFLTSAKAVLGTESGASFVDFTGEVRNKVEGYEAAHPDASFETVRDLFLEGRDGDITIHVISPRCFEAAALRTLQILYPGEYSDVLVRWRHYVPLERDHSNMAEVAAVLRDPARAEEIIGRAYREIACSDRWSYRALAGRFDRVLDELFAAEPADGDRISLDASAFAAKVRDWHRDMRATSRRERRKYKMALALSRTERAVLRYVDALPAWLSRPIRSIARSAKSALKPHIKRLLLGARE